MSTRSPAMHFASFSCSSAIVTFTTLIVASCASLKSELLGNNDFILDDKFG
jgi:hypothetical protein